MNSKLVVRPYVQTFIDWARDRPDVVVLSADLTNSCEIGRWRDTYPERFFSMGMAEQNMLGFAAGLAREGFRPFVHSFSVFLYRRPYDQLAMSIAYPNLPVRLIGFLPGITTPGGVTHQAIDDIAILRATPNMTVLEVADATEIETILDEADAVDGPVYIRMLRGEVPRLFAEDEPFRLGQGRWLSRGSALTLITSGIATEEGIRANAVLRRCGVAASHLHISTIKPLNVSEIEQALLSSDGVVITVENHMTTGGLGSAVAEVMAGLGSARILVRMGVPDRYAHGASRPYLMGKLGFDARAILLTVANWISAPIDVGLLDEEGPVSPIRSSVNAESL